MTHLAVHLRDGLRGLLGGGVADEAEALGRAVLALPHDAGGGDGAKGGELLAELVVGDHVVEVLDVEVDTLEFVDALDLDLVELRPWSCYCSVWRGQRRVWSSMRRSGNCCYIYSIIISLVSVVIFIISLYHWLVLLYL